ncbi:MAG: efflux RND transporter periplasmic adaptor subunit [Magnetococcales bacterium]|nr:efflux RND transporter periplasmic adaptor subunit [Magnetococcales bacterium]
MFGLFLNVSSLSAKGEENHGHAKNVTQPQKEVGHLKQENKNSDNHDEHGKEETKHGSEHDEHGKEKTQSISLTKEQMNVAGIVVSPLHLQTVVEEIRAPGEVHLNEYNSAKVTPRINAQVIGREAKMGDKVTKGQPLVILSSVEMAQAQGELLVASREWNRVSELGRSVVSDQRFTGAKVAFDQAQAKVAAYGMTQIQIRDLMNLKGNSTTNGSFRLLAPIDGTIIKDDFIVGQQVEPGRVLFDISNESTLWVEARVSPTEAEKIRIDAQTRVQSGKISVIGKVVQIRHTLDETTRTISVRLEIPNKDDLLHPGTFVDVWINGGDQGQALALPKEAVLRSPDGDSVIFIEKKPGEFQAQEVEVDRVEGDAVVIRGVSEGQSVVVKGAFFVQSELAKSGFEVHNH